ncbi:type II secretion system protein [Coraliomargarita parva]|uniref:type II secretion system protein n=1 Tax=Coraliomargarita parva TaxID=3014050 RepID=UPI0022B55D1D|nr:type II secretion system protein [Coraliomargarita parva]
MSANCERRAFTLIELLMVVAVIAVLTALLLPVGRSMLVKARQAKASEQMRQIGFALQCYSMEHNQTYPPVAVAGVPWDREALDAYLSKYDPKGRPVFDGGGNAESTDGADVRRAYSAGGAMFGVTKWNQAINTSKARPIMTIRNAEKAVLIFDARVTWRGLCRDGTDWSRISSDIQNTSLDGNTNIDYRHKGQAQFFFADLHVEALTPEQVAAKFTNRKIYEGLE